MILTPREHEVLVARCQYDTDKATALALGIREQTVRNHLQSIHDKYGEATTLRCVLRALAEGELRWERDRRLV